MPAIPQLRIPLEKQHTCVACGCVFRHPMEKQVAGTAGAQLLALFNPEKQLQREMQEWQSHPQRVVAKHPCPGCGLIQPGMALWSRVGHPAAFLVAFFATLLIAGLSLSPARGGALAWAGVVVFAAVAAVHAVTAFCNPNRNRLANLVRAKQELAAGTLKLVRLGAPGDAAPAPANVTAWHLAALLLVVPAPLAFFYPLFYEAGRPAPPANTHLKPEVVNPGDEVSYSLKGLRVQGVGPWRGVPTVRVLNAREVGAPEKLAAQGSNERWGSEVKVYAPTGTAPLSNGTLAPTICFTLPNDQALAGKTLQLGVNMHMTYAVLQGKYNFRNETASVSDTLSVQLAAPGYSQGLQEAFMPGVACAAVSCVGGLLLSLLAYGSHMKAAPPPGEEVLFPEPAAGRGP
jgi:hypothetical protein